VRLEILFGALDDFLQILDVKAVAVELINILENEFFAIEVDFGVVFQVSFVVDQRGEGVDGELAVLVADFIGKKKLDLVLLV
jgi:hypothetical protein